VLRVLLLVVAAALACGGEGGDSRPAWSVLLLSVDTLRPDYMGLNGYDRPTTPTLDRLLADSFYFERAVAPSTRTTPSLASLLTGSYPHTHGVRRLSGILSNQTVTLAELFGSRGHQTLAVVTNNLLHPVRRLNRGFESYDHAGHGRNATQTTDAAIAAIESLDPSRPAFVWVHLIDPHTPYDSRPELAESFDPGYEGPYRHRFGERAGSAGAERPRAYPADLGKVAAVHDNRLPDEVNAHIRRLYAADIRWTDDELGRVVEAARSVLGDRLIVVFASDHGESLGEHGFHYDHGDYVYDASARVPLAFALPPAHRLAGSARLQTRASLVDVAPTVIDAMGWEVPPEMADQLDGRSLLPFMAGEDPAEVPVFAESGRAHYPKWNKRRVNPGVEGKIRAVWLGDWKLIWTPFRPVGDQYELYDLVADPEETRNLYRSDATQLRSLKAHLDHWVRQEPSDTSPPPPSKEDAEGLRALGYLE